uniref:Uncharacterized protein n=1 Tax=Lepeophtheirus salmonis TaxID=72036 RepID=A0A0K2VAE2_LEPSM
MCGKESLATKSLMNCPWPVGFAPRTPFNVHLFELLTHYEYATSHIVSMELEINMHMGYNSY